MTRSRAFMPMSTVARAASGLRPDRSCQPKADVQQTEGRAERTKDKDDSSFPPALVERARTSEHGAELHECSTPDCPAGERADVGVSCARVPESTTTTARAATSHLMVMQPIHGVAELRTAASAAASVDIEFVSATWNEGDGVR